MRAFLLPKISEENNMNPEIERRNIEMTELRVINETDKKPKIRGYAAVFNKLSEDLGGFREKIDPGTFKDSIGRDDVRALFNHDVNYVLGRNKAGTLTLAEDDKGLSIEIDPPDTSYARDLQESIKRGDISQMSFGFVVLKDTWEYDKKKPERDVIRTLQEVRLFDVSPVTYPAYPQTSVKVRDYLTSIKDSETKGLAQPAESNLDLYKRKIELAKF
jgi:uncharacterized protein